MLAPLEGKAALVTGGSRGIGAAVAQRLAEDGADVALTYQHRADRAAAVVERIKALGRRAFAVHADSADPAAVVGAVDQAATEFGRLDILVNNAGTATIKPIDELLLEELDLTLNVNVRAPVVAAQAAARHMTEGGRIINIGSCSAGHVPFPGLSVYAMSKSALSGLTRGLARDLGPRRITANVIDPGPIDTAMNPADGPAGEVNRSLTALGHYGRPEDVAATVAHLAGESGRFITGAAIAVDGGINA